MIDYHLRAMSSHLIEAREQLSFDWKKFKQQKGMIDYLFVKKQNNSLICRKYSKLFKNLSSCISKIH